MNFKVLITGAKGMLGRAVHEELLSHSIEVLATVRAECDICSLDSIQETIIKFKPSHIINCAAYTAVDKAEEEEEKAYAINAKGSENLAKMCQRWQIQLLHISTDYVFDGENRSEYKESDPTHPLSVYGASKCRGEELILAANPAAIVLRSQWLFGPFGGNFVETMLKLAQTTPKLTVVSDQFGTPTYTRDLAAALRSLLSTEHSGILHYRNGGQASWYDFACEIFRQSDVHIEVEAVDSSAYPRPAHRPKHAVLGMKCWSEFNLPLPHSWQDGLGRYLAER